MAGSGLSPGKKRQASLDALTLRITGIKKQSEERAALFDVRVHAIVRWFFLHLHEPFAFHALC